MLQDDEPQLKQKVKKQPDLTKSREWGGWFGTLVMSLMVPVMFLAPQIACTNNRCRSTYFRMPKDWRVFFNPNAFYAYALYIVVVAILSIIPIGRLVDGQHNKSGILKYRINGNPPFNNFFNTKSDNEMDFWFNIFAFFELQVY